MVRPVMAVIMLVVAALLVIILIGRKNRSVKKGRGVKMAQ